MATIKLKIDEKTKVGKAFIKFLKALSEETDFIEVVKIEKEKPKKKTE